MLMAFINQMKISAFENDVIDKLIDVLDIDDAYENLMKNKHWKERTKKVDNYFAI